MMHIAV